MADAWPRSAGAMAAGARSGISGALRQITRFLFHVKMLSTSTETCFTVTSNPCICDPQAFFGGGGGPVRNQLGQVWEMGALKWERGPIPSPTLQSFSTTSGRESRRASGRERQEAGAHRFHAVSLEPFRTCTELTQAGEKTTTKSSREAPTGREGSE